MMLKRIPDRGPLLLVMNHVNFLEAPVLATHLLPRPVTALAKTETWKNPVLGPLFSLWNAIPIRRGEADLTAFNLSIKALEEGTILAVAPEGTRSGDGRLGQGLPGIVLLALRANAPLQAVANFGHEKFWSDLKHLKRPAFHLRVGPVFRLKLEGITLTKPVREEATREIMYQLAALLPPEYRGAYADLENATTHYLEFLPQTSNQQTLNIHLSPELT
jgi:1-acyl-sn-glycerol-3-phosphate acyltransferase